MKPTLKEQIKKSIELMGILNEQEEEENPFVKLKGQHFEYCSRSGSPTAAKMTSRRQYASKVILKAAGLPSNYSGEVPMKELTLDHEYVKSLPRRERIELRKKIKRGAFPIKDDNGMYNYCRYWIIPDNWMGKPVE